MEGYTPDNKEEQIYFYMTGVEVVTVFTMVAKLFQDEMYSKETFLNT